MESRCARHPKEAGKYYCSKYHRYLCEDCLCCQDAALYCKSRTQCVIWEVSRHERRENAEASEKP